jgi:hypothetical protein
VPASLSKIRLPDNKGPTNVRAELTVGGIRRGEEIEVLFGLCRSVEVVISSRKGGHRTTFLTSCGGYTTPRDVAEVPAFLSRMGTSS